MRIPVDQVAAKLHLAGGTAFDASIFIAMGEDLVSIFAKTDGFIAVAGAKNILLVARASIAAMQVPGARLVSSDELPTEQQAVRVHLRDGHAITGELRWTSAEGYRRTIDFLNESTPYVIVHGGDGLTYVAKAHVAWIEEV